jgi:hypothetical protein
LVLRGRVSVNTLGNAICGPGAGQGTG